MSTASKKNELVRNGSLSVINDKQSGFAIDGKSTKHNLQKKDWSKFSSMIGQDRRDFFSSLFSSQNYSDKQIADLMAEKYQLEKIDFSKFELDPKVVFKIPKKICLKYNLIPIMEIEGAIVVAFSDPGDIQAKDDVSLVTGTKVQMMVAEYSDIRKMIEHYYGAKSKGKIQDLFSAIETSDIDSAKKTSDLVNKNIKHDPTVQSVDYIIKEGIRMNCSDIHIEVYETKCRIRFRVDGHLSEYLHPPLSLIPTIVSRVKVMSKLNISEKRLPQDGRLKIQVDNQIISFRVSTVPVVNGEKIVLRILDTSALNTDITNLGMNKKQLRIFRKYLDVNQGLILMTGPTGSGKTTTIYSGLQLLNKPNRNISTAEDPVEYKLHGINQVQVNDSIGLTFESVLRSFLRQDPDVILIGEIRDKNTANMAYRAAATGHLVLSTLHTNDSSSTITRLMDIGVPSYSVAENTSLVVAQRLLRVLCNNCKEHKKVEIKVLEEIGYSKEKVEEVQSRIMSPKGCQACNYTGYKGREAVFEVLEMSGDLKSGVFKGLSPRELKLLALEAGDLQTLRMSGLEKLAEGITSVDEVIYGTIGDK